ncbi:MAG: glutamate synthase subunit beta [Candidatus Ancillula trichonymphae]|nr:glutamate synthase subunit beta [Candidatus Ancillula trichonymphae]
MGDLRGFIKIRERDVIANRTVSARLADWGDVHTCVDVDQELGIARPQGSRCMDCGIPFCHFSCPLGNLIPEFNDLVYNDKFRQAFERLSQTNNFPEFTGRLCPALCEYGCVLGSIDPSVTICNTERIISDVAFAREYVQPHPPEQVSGKTVAVVGSGPAGLAAAQQLARAGHTVVVYEKDEKVGGLLRYGIPSFKLEKSIIDRRVEQLIAEGVRFRTGIKVGGAAENDISFHEFRSGFDAVLLAIGAGVPNDLQLPGRDLSGIYFAMDYLPNAARSALGELQDADERITAENKNVLIIGGGDTGSDCLGTALRQGAKSITMLQVLPKPPSARASNQPWPMYATVDKDSTSVEEGRTTGKLDLLFETTASRFLGDDNGRVVGAVIERVEQDENGRFVAVPGTEKEIPVDLVLISVGFRGPDVADLIAQTEIELTENALIKRGDAFATTLPDFFVAGDAGRGQSLVVWAIAEGRSAAKSIDEYLTGSSELPAPIRASSSPLRK